jgi:dihydropteroate synthase
MVDFAPVWGSRTYVMGIVNVTPDSFSGDGEMDADAAIAQGLYQAQNGADILDVGGESSRPGSAPVDAAEELRRVIPVVEGLSALNLAPISIDTRRAEVAAAAVRAGATIINDVWGFRSDPNLAGVAAATGSWTIAMHNRHAAAATAPGLGAYFPQVIYDDLVEEMIADLRGSLALLLAAGVAEDRIIIDPGIGFGKTPEQNLQLMVRLPEFRVLGRPILLGTSRKSTIGLVLDLPPSERADGTAATVAIGIQNGADIVRVHDLPAMARVARMADAIVRGWTRPVPVA